MPINTDLFLRLFIALTHDNLGYVRMCIIRRASPRSVFSFNFVLIYSSVTLDRFRTVSVRVGRCHRTRRKQIGFSPVCEKSGQFISERSFEYRQTNFCFLTFITIVYVLEHLPPVSEICARFRINRIGGKCNEQRANK